MRKNKYSLDCLKTTVSTIMNVKEEPEDNFEYGTDYKPSTTFCTQNYSTKSEFEQYKITVKEEPELIVEFDPLHETKPPVNESLNNDNYSNDNYSTDNFSDDKKEDIAKTIQITRQEEVHEQLDLANQVLKGKIAPSTSHCYVSQNVVNNNDCDITPCESVAVDKMISIEVPMYDGNLVSNGDAKKCLNKIDKNPPKTVKKRKKKNSFMMVECDDGKPYQCDMCPFKCSFVCSLRRHKMQHSGEMPFKCKLCPFESRQSQSLKVHTLRHTGETPVQCDQCDFKCRSVENLNRHKLRHSGEQPFQCDVCSFKCRHANSLKYHKMKHSGEYPIKCELCSFKCGQLHDLKRHELIHMGVTPYKCDMCSYICRHRNSLTKHKLTHTADGVPEKKS